MFGSTPYTPRFIPGRSLVPPSLAASRAIPGSPAYASSSAPSQSSTSISEVYAQRTLTLNEELHLSHSRPLALALPPLLTHLDHVHLSLCLTLASVLTLLTERNGAESVAYSSGLALVAILGEFGEVGLRLSWVLDEGAGVARAGWELAKAVTSAGNLEAENTGREYFGKKKEWVRKWGSVVEAVVKLVAKVDAGHYHLLDEIAGEASTSHPLLTQLSTALSILEALVHELPLIISLDTPAKWATIPARDTLSLHRREVDWRALVDHLEPLGRTMRNEAVSLVRLAYRERMYDRGQLEYVRQVFEGPTRWELADEVEQEQALEVRSGSEKDVDVELEERRRVEEWARATGADEDPCGEQSPRSGRREHGVV